MVIDDSYKHLVKEKKNQRLCHPVHGKILIFISIKQMISSTKLNNFRSGVLKVTCC